MNSLSAEHAAFVERVDAIESKSYYVSMARQVDKIYAQLGAHVMYGISVAGEDATRLYIPQEKILYPDYPA
jgi:hypothetical protein